MKLYVQRTVNVFNLESHHRYMNGKSLEYIEFCALKCLRCTIPYIYYRNENFFI